MILLIIKGISTALVYHRRWEPRAHYFTMIQVYNYHPHTQTHTYTNTHTCKVFSSNCYINSFSFFFKAASTLHWGIFTKWLKCQPLPWHIDFRRCCDLWPSAHRPECRSRWPPLGWWEWSAPCWHWRCLLPSPLSLFCNNNSTALVYFPVLTQSVSTTTF